MTTLSKPAIKLGKTSQPTRRQFLQGVATVAAGVCTSHSIGTTPLAAQPTSLEQGALRFGIVADLHHHLAPDAEARLEEFLTAVDNWKPDFLVQLGDFTHRPRDSRSFYRIWEQFSGPRYHVLGNHDMDHEPKAATVDAYGMERSFYSFDAGPFHFVVLDANYLKLDDEFVDYDRGNYFRHPESRGHVSPEQLEWLAADLERAGRPTLLLSHQALDSHGSVANAADVRGVLNRHNQNSNDGSVRACLCGHHHVDDHQIIDNIHYLQINSASYHWVGSRYIENGMATYRDPLFALVTLDSSGNLNLEGRSSEFVPPTPLEMKHPNADRLTAAISDRRIRFGG